MKNVCYDFENNTVLIYNSTDPNLSKLVAPKCINYIDRVYSLAIFYWTGIKFENLNQSFPVNTYYTFEDEGLWIQSIRFLKHVAHFFESISVPFNAMLRPNFFKGPVYPSFHL